MSVRDEVIGILSVICGIMFSVIANATAKMLHEVPLLQMMQMCFAMQSLASLCWAYGMKVYGYDVCLTGRPGSRHLLLLRALTFSISLGALWGAVRLMPLGEVTAIIYLHPICCGFLAWLMLQEKLGVRFLVQALLSCAGVVLVTSPFGGDWYRDLKASGVFLALLSCVGFASGSIVVRWLKDVRLIEIQLWQDVMAAYVLIPAASVFMGSHADWSIWSYDHVLLLLGFTASGLVASLLVITGYMLASASTAALFTYMEVPFAFLVQVLFFDDDVGHIRILGAVLITIPAVIRLAIEIMRMSEEPSQEETALLCDDKMASLPSYEALHQPKSDSLSDFENEFLDGPEASFTRMVSPSYMTTRSTSGRSRMQRSQSERPSVMESPAPARRHHTSIE